MYAEAKRYRTRENIRAELIREIARMWEYDQDEVAPESFDPLVGMLLGAFATGMEQIYHELDNAGSRMMKKLAHLLVPEIWTGPQSAHAVMKTAVIDPHYVVMPEHGFHCNMGGKDFHFSPSGHYDLYKIRLHTWAVQSRIRETGPGGKEYYMNESLPHGALWLGLDIDGELNAFERFSFFFDWRSDTDRLACLGRLAGLRMFVGEAEMRVTPGLTGGVGAEDGQNDGTQAPSVEEHYKNHFFNVASQTRFTGEDILLNPTRVPDTIAAQMNPDELAKSFHKELFWIRMEVPTDISPEQMLRLVIDVNAFPVIQRRAITQFHELRPLFNVVPVRVEDGEQFAGMVAVEAPSGARLTSAEQFGRSERHQYLLRQRGVTRFDERDATEMVRYVADLIRDESAVFKASGQTELDSDVDEIYKRLERINQSLRKDQFPNWFLTIKTPEKAGRIQLRYWATRAEEANGIALGTRLNRDRAYIAFVDESIALVTTVKGGRKPLSGDECLPAFKRAVLSRGRLVTFEDYKAVCRAELGDDIRHVEVRKGFAVGSYPFESIQPSLEIHLTPNRQKTFTLEHWQENRLRLTRLFDQQGPGIWPVQIIVSDVQ